MVLVIASSWQQALRVAEQENLDPKGLSREWVWADSVERMAGMTPSLVLIALPRLPSQDPDKRRRLVELARYRAMRSRCEVKTVYT